MAIQMYDTQGNSKIVDNPQVQDHLRSGWLLLDTEEKESRKLMDRYLAFL